MREYQSGISEARTNRAAGTKRRKLRPVPSAGKLKSVPRAGKPRVNLGKTVDGAAESGRLAAGA